MHIEVSGYESDTKIRLIEFMGENIHLKIHNMGKWFYAVYESRSDASGIMFRVELDAVAAQEIGDLKYKSKVPGVGRLCGHDEHRVSSAATVMADNSGDDHDIYFQFQHVEGRRCTNICRTN